MAKRKQKNDDPDMILELATKVSKLETDVCWIKDKLKTVDKRTWYILSGIIVSILATIMSLIL